MGTAAFPEITTIAPSRSPLDRDALTPGIEDAAGAAIVRAAGGDRARAGALWAAAHGLVDLELSVPIDADIDAAWSAAASAFSPGAVEP